MDPWRKQLIEGINFDDLEYYQRIGFKCGLEIHQQLDTAKKLYCHCPVGYRNDAPDAVILRHMRPTLSEMGTYDGTALMEFKTKKQVVYHLYRDNVCTYEMDDTPPFPINQQAVDYAVEIALMLNCRLVDEVHITRKQYLDGSIPTGFQRTAIIGVDGWVPYRGRRIEIQQLALEEDACREIEDRGHKVVFRTDRLSTPLVEIVTLPNMRTPHEAAEVDELLGRLLRASGRVRRGIGSVRQDVNVSVTGSDRVETKGVPRTPDIRALTHYEALRHMALVKLRGHMLAKGITPDSMQTKIAEVTPLLKHTKVERMKSVLAAGLTVKAVMLAGWNDCLRWKTQPGITFANEIAGRIRVIACLDEMPNMYVLDGMGDGLGVEEEVRVRKAVEAAPEDGVVLVWGPGDDVETACKEVIIRAKEALVGVPQETRQKMPDSCRTDFERILPGPDRMYPDTDSMPVPLKADRVDHIAEIRALRPWEREELYVQRGLSKGQAYKLATHPQARLFERIIAETKLSSQLAATVILEWQKGIIRDRHRKCLLVVAPTEERLSELMHSAALNGSPRRAIYHALVKLIGDEPTESPAPIGEAEVRAACTRLFDAADKSLRKSRKHLIDWLVGEVMESTCGRADPAVARKILEQLVK